MRGDRPGAACGRCGGVVEVVITTCWVPAGDDIVVESVNRAIGEETARCSLDCVAKGADGKRTEVVSLLKFKRATAPNCGFVFNYRLMAESHIRPTDRQEAM